MDVCEVEFTFTHVKVGSKSLAAQQEVMYTLMWEGRGWGSCTVSSQNLHDLGSKEIWVIALINNAVQIIKRSCIRMAYWSWPNRSWWLMIQKILRDKFWGSNVLTYEGRCSKTNNQMEAIDKEIHTYTNMCYISGKAGGQGYQIKHCHVSNPTLDYRWFAQLCFE